MKKSMLVILCVVLLTAALAACSSQPDPSPSPAEPVVPAAAAKTMCEKVAFADLMSEADAATVRRIFALDAAAVPDAAGYLSTGATAEELFVFSCADESGVGTVKKAVETRLGSQREGYADYGPAEVPKIDAAVVETRGLVVFVCVCDDPAQARAAIDEIAGK